jgi:HAD superfamily hydrolase (TIGR01509 family)
MFELVIFDCDGVLVDSERLAIKVDAIVLGQLGLNLSEDQIVERFMGLSQKEFQSSIEILLGRPLSETWEAETTPMYTEAYRKGLKPVEGIREAIDQISVPTCVASSGSHEKMRFTLGLTGLYSLFEGRIFSATEVARGKPEPDLFLHAARSMRVRPQACAVVEDSAHGVAAARAAGMQVFGFAGSMTPAGKLEGPNTTVFEHMSELPKLLRQLWA